MAFTPKLNWATNQVVPATDLIRIEQGVTDGDVTNPVSPAALQLGTAYVAQSSAFITVTGTAVADAHAARDKAAPFGADVYFPPGTYTLSNALHNVPGQKWILHKNALVKQATTARFGVTLSGGTKDKRQEIVGGVWDGQGSNSASDAQPIVLGPWSTARDLTVQNSIYGGVSGYNADGMQIIGCRFFNIGSGGFSGGFPMLLDNSGNSTSAFGWVVEGNYVDNTAAPNSGGVGLYSNTDAITIVGAKIINNTIKVPASTSSGGAYYVRNLVNPIIAGNYGAGGYMPASFPHITGGVISDNTFMGGSFAVLELPACVGVKVIGNTLDGNGTANVGLFQDPANSINTSHCLTAVNTILNIAPGGSGIQSQGGTDNTYVANDITLSAYGVAILANGSALRTKIIGNTIDAYGSGGTCSGVRVNGDFSGSVMLGNTISNTTNGALILYSASAVALSKVHVQGNNHYPASGTFLNNAYATGSMLASDVSIQGTPSFFNGLPVVAGDAANSLTAGEAVLNRLVGGHDNVTAVSSGVMLLTYFTASKTETITKVRVFTGTTPAAATPTLVRIGVYALASDGTTLNLVASSANDTAALAAANTAYTETLTSSLAKVAGQRYAIGILVVSTGTMPSFVGYSGLALNTTNLNTSPRIAGYSGGQTDLPTPVYDGGLSPIARMPQFELLP